MKKKNSRLLIHKAYLITGVKLIYHFAWNKKVYVFQTPRLAGLCETTWYLIAWKHATSRPPLQRSHMRRRLTVVLAWFGIFLSGAHWADQLLDRSFFTHTVSIELNAALEYINAALAVMPSSRQLSIGNARNVLIAVTGVNLQKYGNASQCTYSCFITYMVVIVFLQTLQQSKAYKCIIWHRSVKWYTGILITKLYLINHWQ